MKEYKPAQTESGKVYALCVTYRPGKRQVYTAMHNGKPIVSGCNLDEVCKVAACMIDERELYLER
jgi:hypothetical protein